MTVLFQNGQFEYTLFVENLKAVVGSSSEPLYHFDINSIFLKWDGNIPLYYFGGWFMYEPEANFIEISIMRSNESHTAESGHDSKFILRRATL